MDELYRDYILEHYKNPKNFGELPERDLEFHDKNPLCGDEITIADYFGAGMVSLVDAIGRGRIFSGEAAVKVGLVDELGGLADAIASNKRRLTSLERYEKELASGRLEWTAVHGADPNWGRVAMAIGKCSDDTDIDQDRVVIKNAIMGGALDSQILQHYPHAAPHLNQILVPELFKVM